MSKRSGENLQVIILCGGMGTRLREETEARPKPMITIGSRPILWHIMKYFSHFGHRDFILCLGYKGESIKEYFYHYEIQNTDFRITLGKHKTVELLNGHDEADWRITLVDTGPETLKGARLKQVEKYVESDDVLVTYGDGVANVDLPALLAFHRAHGRMATITGVRPPSRFGEMLTDGETVVSFTEKPQVSEGLINGGFFVLRRCLFEVLSVDDPLDFEAGTLERLAAEGQLKVFRHTAEWECMDTLRDRNYLNKLWKEGRAFWKVWDRDAENTTQNSSDGSGRVHRIAAAAPDTFSRV